MKNELSIDAVIPDDGAPDGADDPGSRRHRPGLPGQGDLGGTSTSVSISGALSLIVLLIGMAAIVTGVIGRCPMYTLFGISTNDNVSA